MLCPTCQHKESRVLESRSTEGKQSIRRRRECLNCKRRFTTYERIEFVPITIIKKDGRQESFERSKLLRGIMRACEKTIVTPQKVETIVDEIEAQLQNSISREFSTDEVGELVLKHLRHENEVAYVRFASVYRKFQGIKDFIETLNHLQKTTWEIPSDRESELWQQKKSPNSTTVVTDYLTQ